MRLHAGLLVGLLLFTACTVGEVPRDQFDAVVAERDDASLQLADALGEIGSLQNQLESQAGGLVEAAAAEQATIDAFWTQWLSEYDEAFSSLDPGDIDNLFHEDAVYEQASSGLIVRGRNAILVEFVAYWEGFTVFRTSTERFRADDDEIVFLWSGNATRTDGSFELVSGGTYVEIENGQIVRQIDYAEFP